MASCKERGALHRKKVGHVTPKLGTAERQTSASMFTQVNFSCVNKIGLRWVTAISNG